MSRMEFTPARRVKNPVKYIEQPYVRVDIEAKDHTNLYWGHVNNWEHTGNLVEKYIYGVWSIGMEQSTATQSTTLTETITIGKEGKHRLFLRMFCGPENQTKAGKHGILKIYIDDVLMDTIDLYHIWRHWKDYDCGARHLTAGTHTLKIEMTNPGFVSRFILHRVVDYSTTSNHGKTRLGVQAIEFTENNINELNTADITIVPREDYFREDLNEWSGMVFDFTDSINIYVGSNYKDTKVKFGGYITGYEIDEQGYITLQCVDRLIDMQRQPMYKNFVIGIPAEKDDEPVWPHYNMSSAYETIRHLAETSERGINTSRIDYDYGFKLNFGDMEDYGRVTTNGFSKMYDKRAGNPPPCLRLGIDQAYLTTICGDTCSTDKSTTSLTGNVIIFQDDEGTEYDATVHNILAFDYMAGGTASKYPLQFNIEITMFKEGETTSDAETYNIIFTGKRTGVNHVIHTYKPTINGEWKKFKVDLKKLFDNYTQSPNYYITKVQFTNVFTERELKYSNKTAMNIDNVMSYDSVANSKHHQDMEATYALEMMQNLAEESMSAVYVDYAEERRDDVLVMMPEEGKILDEVADEGFNVLYVTNISYQPKDEFGNRAVKYYHKTDKNDKEKTYKVSYNNWPSMVHYGHWETFEDLSDVDNKTDAIDACEKEVEQGSYGKKSFSVQIKGTTLLEPCQYLTCNINTQHIQGTHKIMAIIHNINFGEAPTYTTQIDLGAASEKFKNYMIALNKRLKFITNKDLRNTYNSKKNTSKAHSSVGTFVKSSGGHY